MVTLKKIVKWVLIVIAGVVVFWLAITYGVLGLRTVVDWSAKTINQAWTGNVPSLPSAPIFAPAQPTDIPEIVPQVCKFKYAGVVFEQPYGPNEVPHELPNGDTVWIICDRGGILKEQYHDSIPEVAPPTSTPSASGSSRTIAPTGACRDHAKVLGPFAPDGSTPEAFTIDANKGEVHLSFWIPGLSPSGEEHSVILNGGIYHFKGGGQAWQWIGCHDTNFAMADAIAHGQRRTSEGKTFILSSIEQLKAKYPDNVSW